MPGVQGRVALVTGASRGIGLVTAQLLIEKGAKVMAVASVKSLDALKANFDEHGYCTADLSTREGCQAAVDATLAAFDGRIDILVCNHGIGSAHETSLETTDIDAFLKTMKTNLEGPFYLTRFVFPIMTAQKYGRLVYTSSTAALEGGTELYGVAYNTSKAGLNGLMRSASQDGGIHNITANSVCPGWVKTEMADAFAQVEATQRNTTPDVIWKERAAIYPPKRVVTPEEVAHSILFLASEESSGISGESIRVSLGCAE